MNKISIILAALLIFVSGCNIAPAGPAPESGNENQNSAQGNGNENDTTRLANPALCEKNSDCIAVAHPSNGCYKAYFNKTAIVAIEQYQNTKSPMIQDCPQFGPAVCRDNECQAEFIK